MPRAYALGMSGAAHAVGVIARRINQQARK
jgi:hypothetical protein